LDEFDLQLAAGERLALLGPTGSGKSTLIRLVQGLENPDSGEIFLDGKSLAKVPPHLRNVTLLPQRPALYPQLTARQNIDIVTPIGQFKQEMLDILNLGSLLDRYPHQLSGGEKQRVALAKILRRGAGLWLLDEPFAALDQEFRSEFRYDLHLLLEASSATIIVVTHDPIDALALGQRIGVLSEGRLLQLGSAGATGASYRSGFVWSVHSDRRSLARG
jgi:ABC-type Fe3+/spermidine/putrescine transport system ATPase subunit